jgi:hypothetical protein
MTEYCSCVHISPEVVATAVRKVKYLSLNPQHKLATLFQCLDCDFVGSFKDSSLKRHLSAFDHHFAMRCNNPHELYCFKCQDFQFSSVFDRYCKKKRSRSTLLQASMSKRVGNGGGKYAQIKGLCNMGATCFMSSVLQVLMKNSVLMCCDQLQYSVDRCKSRMERTISENSGNKQAGDLTTDAATILPSCIFCEFKKLNNETER